MKFTERVQAAQGAVTRTVRSVGESEPAQAVARLATLEVVLAVLCIFTPVVLIAIEGGILGSISAYYETADETSRENQWFYVPLTAAVMLFIVNGVRHKGSYNVYLGLALAGVLLFNKDDQSLLHGIFAIIFFTGNFLVILFYSRGSPIPGLSTRAFKGIFLVTIVVAMLGHFAFDWYSLFWAEWISFAAIAAHFLLDSSPFRYSATPSRVPIRELIAA